MGFIQRMFGDRPTGGSDQELLIEAGRSGRARPEIGMQMGVNQDLAQLAGTTTFARDAMAALAVRYGITGGGHTEVQGVLQREPDNLVDSSAVAVVVDGEKVGNLPGPLARVHELPIGAAQPVRVQVFAEVLAKGLRVEAWVWLGSGAPEWRWSATNRPPMSSKAKNMARHAGHSSMVAEALAEGGPRGRSFTAGMVNGVHYLELIEPIKELKREGRLEEALVLCYAAIAGAEADRDGREPAPAYTEQAAIMHRKLGQREEEIAVLRRWLRLCPPANREGTRIGERLAKL